MRRNRMKLENRRGATLAVVAVSLVAMLAVMALAIDLGMMFSARNEAQRVADASALAGASAFLQYEQFEAVPYAQARADSFIVANTVMGEYAELADATVEINPNLFRVRVTVRKPLLRTWFARFFGVDSVGVSAFATAEATNAGGAKCVRPWAIQDMWHEPGERLAVEGDMYNSGADGDRYNPVPVNNLDDPTATGYGANSTLHYERDFGYQITLKAQTPVKNPNSDEWEISQPGPGEFMIWDLPEDPTQEFCYGETKYLPGKDGYAQDICSCNKSVIELGEEYPLEFGNVVGPGFKGVDLLVASDPGATWDAGNKRVVGSNVGDDNWMSSPRVVPIGLIAPLGPPEGQSWNPSVLRTVTFTNIALFFLEGYDDGKGKAQPSITGRFLYYAPGEQGEVLGSLTRFLRLVE